MSAAAGPKSIRLHALAGALAGFFCAGAGAQQQPPQQLQRVEITGSSIKRIEGETALPVQVLTRDEIRRSGAATVEELMRTVAAASSSGNITASSSSGATTGGLSSISLRGLTSLRTLVLLNGRRLSAYGIGFTGDSVSVDINAIPLAAIERIEILKDGASAVYGSDAIAGVVNLILRRDYEGLEATAEAGDSTAGGARALRGSLAWGQGDLQRDRYNLFAMISLHDEQPLFGAERSFSSSSINLATLNDGTSGNSFPANIVLQDGTGRTLNPNFPNCAPSVVSPVYEAIGVTGICRYDPSPFVALLPDMQRVTLFAAGRFALTDQIEAFAEASLYRGKQRTVIQPVPISDQFALPPNHPLFAVAPYNGFSTIVMSPSSPFYPTAFVRSQVGAGNALPDLLVRYRSVITGDRDVTDEAEAPRLALGLKGTAASWDFDTALLYSASKVTQQVNGGFPLLTQILPLLNSGRVNFFGPNAADVQADADATQFRGTAFVNSTSLTGVSARMSRGLFDLAGGPFAVALGGEARVETYEVDPSPAIQSGDVSGYGGNFLPVDQDRKVAAVFGELSVPLLKSLEVGFAVRHDKYEGSGSATTPKASLRWQPAREVLLRAAIGKGFRAPSLGDLYSPQTTGVTPNGQTDPLRCPTTGSSNDCGTQFPTLNGGNPDLKPERSRNVSLGVVLEPVRDVSVAIDVFQVRIADVITNGIGPEVILADQVKYGNLVTRGPVDPAFPNIPGPITQLSQTNINLGSIRVKGIDLDARWRLQPGEGIGRLTFALAGSYFIDYDVENVDGTFSTAIDVPNQLTSGLISRWRHHLSATWERGPFEVSLAQNYQKDYKDIPGLFEDTSAPDFSPRRVGAYQTWDAQVAYAGVKNLRLALGVRNLFDRDPPFTNTGGRISFQAGYDPQYADPRGRFVYARASYKFF